VTDFVLVRNDRISRFVYLPHTSVSAILIFVAYVVNQWLWASRQKRVESYVKMN
jgi:hypothetical protein